MSTSRTTIMKAINTVICSRGVTCETTLLKPTMLPAPGSSHVVINNSNNSSLSKTIKFRQSSTSKILFKRLPILKRRIFYSGCTCICYAKFLRFLFCGRAEHCILSFLGDLVCQEASTGWKFFVLVDRLIMKSELLDHIVLLVRRPTKQMAVSFLFTKIFQRQILRQLMATNAATKRFTKNRCNARG